jgi:NCS1 family nucleobase:cation symporter-1
MESIKKFEVWAGPLVYLVFGGMVWWAIDIAGGLGPIYSQPGKFHTFSEMFWPFAAGVTGIIGITSGPAHTSNFLIDSMPCRSTSR